MTNPLITFNNYVENVKPSMACLLPDKAENTTEYLANLKKENCLKIPIADIRTKDLVEVDEHPEGLYVDDGVNKYFVLD